MTQWHAPDLLKQHSVDMRQFVDFRQSTLPNGMRIIDAYNASGLHFTILPDRGMDIWTAHYKGMPLTWISQGSPHPPDMAQGWLRQFNGGLLTTCGLTHAGPPEVDTITGEQRGIHGKYTFQRAYNISQSSYLEGDEYVCLLEGHIAQSSLFSEQLQFVRTVSMSHDFPSITIMDQVKNRGDEPVPFMLLYHCNLGYPLIREGTELLTASDVYPRDNDAKSGVETWSEYASGSPQYAEQVFFHHSKYDGSRSRAVVINDDIGLEFEWMVDNMPYLTQWKNTRQGIYVSGIEPGNCIPEGQNAARESGRLVMLQPGEMKEYELEITVLDSRQAIESSRAGIADLQKNGTPISGCDLSGYEKYTP